MIYNSVTGGWNKAAGVTLEPNTQAEMRTFLDYLFLVNGVNSNLSYDGTTWSDSVNVRNSPIARFVEKYNTRLYLGYIKINSNTFRSRVWFSNLPKANGTLEWGMETGTDLSQTASSAVITSASAAFKSRGIKTGDPFTIENGNNNGVYIVKSIDSETQITLVTTLTYTVTSSTYWVGGNFFDVQTDDGDYITGESVNSNELLIFKRNALFKYNGAGGSLKQVKGVPGTTSRSSIVTLGDYTYYFYPNVGIIRYNGVSGTIISNAVIDAIENISSANYTSVVGFTRKDRYVCFYIGSVTLRDTTSITNCIICFDTVTSTWSISDYGLAIKAATKWLQSNNPKTFVGDDSSKVYQIDTGTALGTGSIPFRLRTQPIFPAGENATIKFDRVRISVDNGLDLQAVFKLLYKPDQRGNVWVDDKDWRPLYGSLRGSRGEFKFPNEDARGAGVVYEFIESSSRESFLLEEFITYYSSPSDL